MAGRNIPSAFLRRYNIFREMATGGAKKASEKSVRKKRFAYYVGFRTWSDDATAHLPLSFSGVVGRGVAGRTTKFCGGFCTSPASADRFQHLNARRRRERERERRRRGGERESDFPDFPFSGQKVASIPFYRSSVVPPFVLLCHSCCKTASFISRWRDDGRTTCADERKPALGERRI